MQRSTLWIASFLLAAAGQAGAVPVSCVESGGGNCPARILDAPQGAITSTIEVPAVECPASEPLLSVAVDVTHSAVGDLTISVESPGGETATLLANLPGVSGTCRGGDITAIFNDDGAAPGCAATIPSVGGTIAATTPLAPLLASSPAGTWTLTITDDANSDDGALNDWSVDVVCAPPPAVGGGAVPAPLSWQALAGIALLLTLAAFGALRRQHAAR